MGLRPRSRSRTHPPAQSAWCPACRSWRTTSVANSRRRSGGGIGGPPDPIRGRRGPARAREGPDRDLRPTVTPDVPGREVGEDAVAERPARLDREDRPGRELPGELLQQLMDPPRAILVLA